MMNSFTAVGRNVCLSRGTASSEGFGIEAIQAGFAMCVGIRFGGWSLQEKNLAPSVISC